MAPNRQVLTVLCVVLLGLVLMLLYKVQTLNSQLSQQRPSRSSRLSAFMKLMDLAGDETVPAAAPPATATKSQVPRTISREEQIKAGNTLRELLTRRPVSYKCNNIRALRNRVKGTWRYCNDGVYEVTKPCLVYSFGVNYDFGFEDKMAELGCEVLSFDPSMNMTDHRRSPQVMFYATGLGHEDTDTFDPYLDNYVKEKTTWKMRTLQSLLRQHNHTERVIDVLKMDIETYEWNVTRNMLDTGALKNVKQFLLEWHICFTYPAREEFPRMAATLQDVDKAGFQHFYKNPFRVYTDWNKFRIQSDTGYVNSNFKQGPS